MRRGNTSGSSIDISKYLKIDEGVGRILSAFYTAGQDEKLKSFTAASVNIGDKHRTKDLIGIRNNTKLSSANSKAKSRPIDDVPNYSVLSFENRKKSSSPFIEYPLYRFDTIVYALQKLKERAIESVHYKEQRVFSSKYP